MSVNENEYLSALVDGELQGADLDWILQHLAQDPSLRTQFKRYQLTSDVMHDAMVFNPLQGTAVDLTQRISAVLADEPAYSSAAQQTIAKPPAQENKVIPIRRGFWKQATGLAMAASVGAVAVLGVMTSSQYAAGPETVLAANTENTVNVASNRWTVGEPEVADRLNSYLVNHSEYTGASGAFSYARVVAYDDE